MSPWAMHFASGNSLFSGTLLVLIAVFTNRLFPGNRCRAVHRILLIAGVLFILLSATPWPLWVYGGWLALVAVAWRLRTEGVREDGRESPQTVELTTVGVCARPKSRGWLPLVSLLVTSGGLCAWEASTLFTAPVSDPPFPRMYLIGDSLSAGTGVEKFVWADFLRDDLDADIVDLSRPGATAKSALEQADGIPADGRSLILVEIGGNDLLSDRPVDLFQQDLRRLLDRITGPSHRVLMMELPLPPWQVAYGRVQRQLAAEYDAILISKREFAKVLTARDATIDHLHLSSIGHREMAATIARHVRDRLEHRSQPAEPGESN